MTIADNLNTLGLHHEEVVTHDKVRKAYRGIAKKAHPDAHTIPTRKRDAFFEFIKIKNAHDELLDHISHNGPIDTSIPDFSSEETDETTSDSDKQKVQYNERMRQRYENLLHKTPVEKFCFSMPWVLVFGPSLFVAFITVLFVGLTVLGIPGSIVHGVGIAKYGDDWPRVSEKYIVGPLYFLTPILIYVLPVLACAEIDSVNWTQVYIWWAVITPATIYKICLQIEALFILKKAKRTFSLM